MRSPRVTEENLANQIAVVKEEIKVNVLNQPYGGFPWLPAATAAVRHVPQRPQRLWRFRGPRQRHGRGRAGVLQALLRAGQRRPRRRRRHRPRRDAGADREALRLTSRGARHRHARASPSPVPPPSAEARSSTQLRRRRPSPWAGGCPTRSVTWTPTCRSSCWPTSWCAATRRAFASDWCTTTTSSRTSRQRWACSRIPFDVRDPTMSHRDRVPRQRGHQRRRRDGDRRGDRPARRPTASTTASCPASRRGSPRAC